MHSLIINFEQVIRPFLNWNIYFTFIISGLLNFLKSNIKSNCILLLFTNMSEAVIRRCSVKKVFCKKGVPRNFAEVCNFIKKETLAQLFSCEFFAKFLRTPFLTEHNTSGHCFWHLRVNLHLTVLELCSKQVQYLKFKWTVLHGNIIEDSKIENQDPWKFHIFSSSPLCSFFFVLNPPPSCCLMFDFFLE